MAIYTREEWDNFPGAIVICELPFFCPNQPGIQALGGALMSAAHNKPSTIVGGIIYTEASRNYVVGPVCGL